MKEKNQKKYYINLYILVPFIYAGIAVIGVIMTYQLSGQIIKNNQSAVFTLTHLLVLIAALTFFVSLLIIRKIMKPVVEFIKKTQKLPIMSKESPAKSKSIIDDVKEIEKVFGTVADILSSVKARELFPHIIGSSPAMRNVFTQITKVAPADSTVLICGESGTGKELIADSIYEHSKRKGMPFVKINCVAIPEGLLESELFGHEKGAFTGAVSRKKGKFEIADGGTVFLDEIGDMPLATQAKLLRVLQEKEFERVGGSASIKIDVRFIAATNKDLSKLIREGLFREDLYYRLNVFAISLPPLRERIEDISLLANYFLGTFRKKVSLSSAALQFLIGYSWPGNVRELKNILEQASVLAEKDVIEPHHLPEIISHHFSLAIDNDDNNGVSLDERLNIMEKEIIIKALKTAGGVQKKAADLLGINQRSLWHRIRKYDIDIGEIKNLHLL